MKLETAYRNLAAYDLYRASLHNHTFKSGIPRAAPSVAVGIFRMLGIQLVALTDHDRRIDPSRDITKGFVPWREEDWYHEYDDCLLIRGFEASFPQNHVNILGIPYHETDGTPGEPGYIQALQSRGAFCVLNHPARHNDDPAHVLDDANLRALDGIEIYNGNQSKRGPDGLATPLWDACLSHGLEMWCLANSDCHRYHFNEPTRPDNGYNVVWLEQLSEEAFFAALRAGRFYATSGLEVDRVEVGDGTIAVEAREAAAIRFIGSGGTVLAESREPAASYRVQGDEGYVRVELDGKEQVYPTPEEPLPVQAWLQPIGVKAE